MQASAAAQYRSSGGIMAGTFTHWMVVEEALDKYNGLPDKHSYFPIVLGLNHFVCLGAVGPDYPYLSELLSAYLKTHSWADRMHYEQTGEFVVHGARGLLGLTGDAFDICLAWLAGFASHLVTDAVVHPVVNSIVGPYLFNSSEHRHCEMTQDSHIFHEIKGVDIRYAEYVGLLSKCSDLDNGDKINPHLGNFWIETLKKAHPSAEQWFDRIEPDDWHENFMSKIASASDPIAIFRHIGEGKNLVYKKTRDINPDERKRFIDEVRLPGNRLGRFREDVFDKAVGAVMDAWGRLFLNIESAGPDMIAEYIKNWNLDTGVDEERPQFWI